jgi:hypothetical protein
MQIRISIVIAFGLLVAGCFSPSFHSGDLQCAAGAQCPPGFHCAQLRCWKNGENPPPQYSAAVWTSCGGGDGASSVSGANLQLSIGGGSVVGRSTATDQSDVAFGYFTNLTY